MLHPLKSFLHSSKSRLNLGLRSSITNYDLKIQKIISYLDKKGNNIRGILDDNLFEITAFILSKTQRNENELKILQSYLYSLKKFVSLLGVNKEEELNPLLRNISIHLKGEKFQSGKMVFRYGDKGTKFYLILKGSISVMILKENKIRLNYYEYIVHLIKLYAIGEVELMIKIIKANKNIYDINESEIIGFVNRYNQKIEKELDPNKNYLLKFDEIDIKNITETLNDIYFEIEQVYNNANEYMNIIFPFNINEKEFKNFNEKQLIIYSYFEITKSYPGEFFGEIALEKKGVKRSATILCSEDCLFGTLSKDAYKNSLKEIQTNERRNNIKTLMSFQIFDNLSWGIFQNNFFNYFKIIHVYKNEIIIEKNTPIKNINFIRKGEFEISSDLSNKEIDDYILHLKYGNHYKEKKINNKIYENDKKRNLRIYNLKDKDVIGLYDIIDLDEINSIVNIKCISNHGILYSIEKEIFEEIALKVKTVKDNFIHFTNIRRKIMINRLNILKNTKEIKHIEIKKETLFEELNKIYNDNKENKNINRNRLFSPLSKIRQFNFKTIEKSTKNNPSFFKIQKDKKVQLLYDKKEINNNIPFQKYNESIPKINNKNLSPISNHLSYNLNTINTDSTLKKSRNFISKNITSFLSGNSIKNILESSKINHSKLKYDNKKENEKIIKKIVGNSYKKKSNSLNFKFDSKGEIYINELKKTQNISNLTPFVNILQFDTLYSTRSNNYLSIYSSLDFDNF